MSSESRAAVDRYINDFEKLLADVARNDRDRVLTQSYLTSDTGKVYTMLAHAAGRFLRPVLQEVWQQLSQLEGPHRCGPS